MAKELPYFKFETSRWLLGGIMDHTLEEQAVFINICALYWERSGELNISDIDRKAWFKAVALDSLSDRLISLSDGKIGIKFLDEQLTERRHKSELNSKNGRLGGVNKHKVVKANAKRTLSEKKRTPSQLEEKRIEYTTNVVLHPLQEWLQKECPTVCKMKKTITFDEAAKLVRDFPDTKRVENTFYSMENSAQLLKKYQSANLTVRNWLNRDPGSQQSHSTHKGLA